MSNKIHFFTFATNTNHHLERLLSSTKQHNINITILGMGEPYQGNGMKITLLLKALESLPKSALFMYVDAYDVIFLANEVEILDTYNRHYHQQLVYGGEQNFGMYSFDDIYYFFKYPIKKERYKYLNAGTFMGPVGAALDLYSKIGLKESQKSDQMDTIRYFSKNKSKIVVDQQQCLFAVNGGRSGLEDQDYEVKNDRLYAKRSNNWPTLLHVPGKFFIGLDKIAYELGYMSNIPEYTKKEIKWCKSNKRDHMICDALGIENYILRLIKNWSVNFAIIGFIIWIILLIFT